MEIEEYLVVEADTTSEISKTVNKYIKNGYQLYGNLAISGNQYKTYYVQALVKYKSCLSYFKNVHQVGWNLVEMMLSLSGLTPPCLKYGT